MIYVILERVAAMADQVEEEGEKEGTDKLLSKFYI